MRKERDIYLLLLNLDSIKPVNLILLSSFDRLVGIIWKSMSKNGKALICRHYYKILGLLNAYFSNFSYLMGLCVRICVHGSPSHSLGSNPYLKLKGSVPLFVFIEDINF